MAIHPFKYAITLGELFNAMISSYIDSNCASLNNNFSAFLNEENEYRRNFSSTSFLYIKSKNRLNMSMF